MILILINILTIGALIKVTDNFVLSIDGILQRIFNMEFCLHVTDLKTGRNDLW